MSMEPVFSDTKIVTKCERSFGVDIHRTNGDFSPLLFLILFWELKGMIFTIIILCVMLRVLFLRTKKERGQAALWIVRQILDPWVENLYQVVDK